MGSTSVAVRTAEMNWRRNAEQTIIASDVKQGNRSNCFSVFLFSSSLPLDLCIILYERIFRFPFHYYFSLFILIGSVLTKNNLQACFQDNIHELFTYIREREGGKERKTERKKEKNKQKIQRKKIKDKEIKEKREQEKEKERNKQAKRQRKSKKDKNENGKKEKK